MSIAPVYISYNIPYALYPSYRFRSVRGPDALPAQAQVGGPGQRHQLPGLQ